ncbi:hypothetical protein AMATHDRAFT_143312 [Amanita thiersii Skay4041]|uniref:Ketopantoate reductase C-terminal domain-containing protein n=1 Tax=Amanita thiersii Skay4041 TaxID=703135 RepID=A0A2A9NKP2_9AGAR|nr:hypothetical protein AMATHDRAFT_143312 [Amanita thiersii Skay4041]
MKDVLLIGFGAVGAIYSLILERSREVRVTVVARSNYEIVKDQGMTFHSKKYGEVEGWRPYRLCRSVHEAADRHYSYVLITTKAVPEIQRTPDLISPLLRAPYIDLYELPTYVVMQNGLGVERDLYKAVQGIGKDEPTVIGTAVWIGTNLVTPNEVEHTFFDRVSMGIYRDGDMKLTENSPKETAILEEFKGVLSAGGSEVTIVPQIQWTKYAKNFWNVAFASISTLTGYTLPAFFRPPPTEETGPYAPYVDPTTADKISVYTLPNIEAIMAELVQLGHAMGIPETEEGLPPTNASNVFKFTRQLHMRPDSVHIPSMMLDAQKGQPLEVEVIIGEVVQLAREYKVDIPRIEMLYSLLVVVQNQILRKRAVSAGA